ncbi:MAG: amidohydrolase [Candidatus Rokuibacteriota bacterium]|nr:MAG: amidohydrolase [Candidatus Rokubacteria bacterium]
MVRPQRDRRHAGARDGGYHGRPRGDGCRCVILDVHTHFIPRFVAEDAADGGVFGVRADGGWLVHPQGYRYPVVPEFLDAGAKLADMDRLGIDASVLSIAPTLFFYDQPAAEAASFAERANDALAELVAGEERLRGFATLPLQDGGVAAAELERSVRTLALVGAQIGTNCGPTPIDAPELAPVLETAELLGVPLMLHPYYVGPKPMLEDFYFTNSVGNPLDTCIAAARLIHSGALDRHPGLRVVLVHAGGFMPYQLGRLDHAFEVRQEPRVAIEREPSSYLGRFWFDSITHSDASLEFLVSFVGTDRIVLGTDLPFDMGDPVPLERIRRVGVDPDELGSTAATLLGIEVAA